MEDAYREHRITRKPIHPGVAFAKFTFPEMGLTEEEFSQQFNVDLGWFRGFLKGEQPITLETAIKFANHFGTDSTIYFRMQNKYDQWVFQRQEADNNNQSPGELIIEGLEEALDYAKKDGGGKQ